MKNRRSSRKRHNNEARQPCVGVEAAVVWGGALAIAGLVTLFTLKITRRRNLDKEEDKGSSSSSSSSSSSQVQGLPLILQSNPTENHSFAGRRMAKTEEIQIKSFKSVSTQSLILEEKTELCISNGEDENNPEIMLCSNRNEEIAESCHQEILLSDDSAKESVTSSDDCSKLEELTLIMNDSGEVLQLLKTIDVKKDDEEDDDVESGENITEKEEERWELTGSSSVVESINEAVWAEETIQISSPESESESESTVADHVGEKTEEETTINGNRVTSVGNSVVLLNEKETNGEVVRVMNDEDERWRKWRARVQSAMAFLLLLSLLLYLYDHIFNVDSLGGF